MHIDLEIQDVLHQKLSCISVKAGELYHNVHIDSLCYIKKWQFPDLWKIMKKPKVDQIITIVSY